MQVHEFLQGAAMAFAIGTGLGAIIYFGWLLPGTLLVAGGAWGTVRLWQEVHRG